MVKYIFCVKNMSTYLEILNWADNNSALVHYNPF